MRERLLAVWANHSQIKKKLTKFLITVLPNKPEIEFLNPLAVKYLKGIQEEEEEKDKDENYEHQIRIYQ